VKVAVEYADPRPGVARDEAMSRWRGDDRGDSGAVAPDVKRGERPQLSGEKRGAEGVSRAVDERRRSRAASHALTVLVARYPPVLLGAAGGVAAATSGR
jgi:hypothetical protein